MANAGLTSQKALACDIARREGLENSPTGLVSKVINEEKVDPPQLARVALALGVPVQAIYHDRQDGDDVAATNPVTNNSTSGTTTAGQKVETVVTEPRVEIISLPAQQHATRWPRPLSFALAAMGVLAMSIAVWYFSVRRDVPAGTAVSVEAMRDFRQAQAFLDSSPNELNLRRAQSHLEAALRKEPSFRLAAAQLCETLVRQSWAHDEEGALNDAQTVCDRARAMDGELVPTRIAYAHLLLRTGRAAEGALMLEELIVKDPDNRDALLLASDARIAQFLKTGERHFATKAASHARRAVEVVPLFWRTHWQLGRASFELGNLDDAIHSYKEAARLDPNEYVLGNLGAVSFCNGDVQGAHDVYLQAQRVTGNPQLGEEYMGMFYYYLGAFEQSLVSRKSAVDAYDSESGPEIHQIWGDLGDSYRRMGQATPAVEAYERAIRIVDRDFENGNATAGDRAYRAYYRVAAGHSAGSVKNQSELRADLEQVADITEPGALVRIAIAWRLLGEREKSQQAAEHACAKCPVYKSHPDLVRPL